MQIKKILLALVLGSSILALAACSTTGKQNMGAGSAQMAGSGNGAYASGTGGRSGFGGGGTAITRAVGGQNQTFYFAFDNSAIKPAYMSALAVHAKYLKSHPNKSVKLEGNTDARGSREYNIALGWRRADAVAKVLELDGVPKRQLQEVSYGQERPVALGHTESAYRLNRRVDLVYEK